MGHFDRAVLPISRKVPRRAKRASRPPQTRQRTERVSMAPSIVVRVRPRIWRCAVALRSARSASVAQAAVLIAAVSAALRSRAHSWRRSSWFDFRLKQSERTRDAKLACCCSRAARAAESAAANHRRYASGYSGRSGLLCSRAASRSAAARSCAREDISDPGSVCLSRAFSLRLGEGRVSDGVRGRVEKRAHQAADDPLVMIRAGGLPTHEATYGAHEVTNGARGGVVHIHTALYIDSSCHIRFRSSRKDDPSRSAPYRRRCEA